MVNYLLFTNGLIGSINGVLWPYAESLLTLKAVEPDNTTIDVVQLLQFTCSNRSVRLSLLFYGHPSAPLTTGSNLL
jgi:hypothetical protein